MSNFVKSVDRKIIAPIGFARTGKDEFAKVLVEEYGYTRFAFADKLRECLYALNPRIRDTSNDHLLDRETLGKVGIVSKDYRLQDAIEQYGWDGYKASPYGDEIRGLLQRFGTEVGRDLIDQDIWLKELDKVQSDKIVITDARFPNELQKVLDVGGNLVHVKREGYGPINGHISETAHLEYVDKVVDRVWNNGTLDQYREMIRATLIARNLV